VSATLYLRQLAVREICERANLPLIVIRPRTIREQRDLVRSDKKRAIANPGFQYKNKFIT